MKSKKKSSKKLKTKGKLTGSFTSSIKKAKHVSDMGQSSHIIRKRKLYSPESLQAAYKAVKDSSISVNAAAKQYGVPLTTLRDRVDGRISIDTTRPGPPLLMTREEEAEIAHFLHTMARYGYRYTRLGIAEIATDQAVEKGKRPPRSNGLTTKWVDCFINRWPGVRELSSKFKNKTEAEHTVRTYFDEIKKIIDKYKLLEKSNRIFNIMEVNLVTDHSLSPELSGKTYGTHQFKTENVTNTTMLVCGSVTGNVMPPYFVFQSSKLRPELLRGAPNNVNASISDTGKCSPQIFREFLNDHFLVHCQRFDNEPILILMDGSRSHMFVGMSEWGRCHNVIFSFIPAHTTHLLQPLEVECAEALQRKYESICKKHLRIISNPCISRNSICELACQAFTRTMTRHVVMHSFKKAGVYPDVSSEESGDELGHNDDLPYRDSPKSDDSLHDDVTDEIVFTGDLVVGHNQEVTEEEVVTTQEVILSEDGQTEEVVITPDGQLVLGPGAEAVVSPEGHLIIQGGDIFVTDRNNSFSQLLLPQGSSSSDVDSSSPVKTEPLVAEPLSDTKCIINNGKIVSARRLDTSNGWSVVDSSFNSSDSDFIRDQSDHLIEEFNASTIETVIKTEILQDVVKD